MATIEVTVNGQKLVGEAEPRMLLVHFIRDVLRLTGTHVGCVVGRCGACTILLDGRATKSCMVYAIQADGTEVTTVEGLAGNAVLSRLQDSFCDKDAVECGYCTPGMLMAASGLMLEQQTATRDEIKEAISGNICRCTGYLNIVAAIEQAMGVAGDSTVEPAVSAEPAAASATPGRKA
jgi:carbon-monoxide dehydrogenase small subunit